MVRALLKRLGRKQRNSNEWENKPDSWCHLTVCPIYLATDQRQNLQCFSAGGCSLRNEMGELEWWLHTSLAGGQLRYIAERRQSVDVMFSGYQLYINLQGEMRRRWSAIVYGVWSEKNQNKVIAGKKQHENPVGGSITLIIKMKC